MKFLWIMIVSLCVGCVFQITAEEKVSRPIPKNKESLSKNGFVTGKVYFGPLRPGPERLDDTEELKEIAEEMYKKHKVVITTEDGVKTLKEVSINKKGIYKVELPPGKYLLQITPAGLAKLKKQPMTVVVKEGKTEQVDISVDTGLR